MSGILGRRQIKLLRSWAQRTIATQDSPCPFCLQTHSRRSGKYKKLPNGSTIYEYGLLPLGVLKFIMIPPECTSQWFSWKNKLSGKILTPSLLGDESTSEVELATRFPLPFPPSERVIFENNFCDTPICAPCWTRLSNQIQVAQLKYQHRTYWAQARSEALDRKQDDSEQRGDIDRRDQPYGDRRVRERRIFPPWGIANRRRV